MNKVHRRAILTVSLWLVAKPSIADTEDRVEVNVEGVRTLRGLVAAMRAAAGSRVPSKIDLNEVYDALAEAFLDNAHEALRQGIKLPKRALDLLPPTQKAVLPLAVLVPLWGVIFVIPLAAFFEIMFISVGLIWINIESKAKQRRLKLRRT